MTHLHSRSLYLTSAIRNFFSPRQVQLFFIALHGTRGTVGHITGKYTLLTSTMSSSAAPRLSPITITTFPRPSHPFPAEQNTLSIPLLPLFSPPSPSPPSVSSIPPSADFDRPSSLKGWRRTGHIVPAAYPRTAEGSTITPGDVHTWGYLNDVFGNVSGAENGDGNANGKQSEEERRKARMKAILKASDLALEVNQKARRWTIEQASKIRDEGQLWIAVDRFVPDVDPVQQQTQQKDSEDDGDDDDVEGVSLIFVHATGFMKEMWEPTIASVLEHLEKQSVGSGNGNSGVKKGSAVKIDEIFTFDFPNHGVSYGLNHGRIGPVTEWSDSARDVISVLAALPPLEEGAGDWGHFLPFRQHDQPQGTIKKPRKRIIGVGHSIGGNALVQASHAYPSLMDDLILVDPMCRVIIPELDDRYGSSLAVRCIGRRHIWKSRQEARIELLKSPYFGAWDPPSFDALINHGLVEIPKIEFEGHGLTLTPSGDFPVTLACPRWSEASMFSDMFGMINGWNKLGELRSDLSIKFIMAGDTTAVGGDIRAQTTVWRAPNARNVVLNGSGHLIAQEHPEPLGSEIAKYISGEDIDESHPAFKVKEARRRASKL